MSQIHSNFLPTISCAQEIRNQSLGNRVRHFGNAILRVSMAPVKMLNTVIANAAEKLFMKALGDGVVKSIVGDVENIFRKRHHIDGIAGPRQQSMHHASELQPTCSMSEVNKAVEGESNKDSMHIFLNSMLHIKDESSFVAVAQPDGDDREAHVRDTLPHSGLQPMPIASHKAQPTDASSKPTVDEINFLVDFITAKIAKTKSKVSEIIVSKEELRALVAYRRNQSAVEKTKFDVNKRRAEFMQSMCGVKTPSQMGINENLLKDDFLVYFSTHSLS